MKYRLLDICEFVSDKVDVYNITTNNYISTENMIAKKSGVTVAEKLPSIKRVNSFQQKDVLISNIRPYFQKIWFSDKNGGCSADVLVLRAKNFVVPEFLYCTLATDGFFNYMTATAKGTKMPRGDKQAIQNYEIDLPSIEVQTKIAHIIFQINSKIKVNGKINDNLVQQAKALYDSMFVRNADGLWPVGILADIANITMGQSPSGTSYNEDGNGEVFFQGRGEFGDRFPTRRLYTTEPTRMAERGDVLMSVRAPVGDLNVAYERCCIGRGLGAIHSKDGAQSFLLYTMFSLHNQLNVYNGEGTVFGSINRDALNSMSITIPHKESIQQFEKVVKPMDAVIESNYSENIRLQSIRDALMSKLISGEIDVSDVNL